LAAFTEITIEQGATFSTTVNVEDAYYNPVNLTGYSASSQMRKSYYSSSATNITASVTGTSNGEITLSMTAANTSSLTPGRYVYDLIIDDGANTVTRVVEGIATVLPSVTR
jgi:hypothetical protein